MKRIILLIISGVLFLSMVLPVSAQEMYSEEQNVQIIYDSSVEIKELVPAEITSFDEGESGVSENAGKLNVDIEKAQVIAEDMASARSSAREVVAGRAVDFLTGTGDAKIYQLTINPGLYLQAQLTQPKNAGIDYDLYIMDADANILSYSEYYTNINGTAGTLAEAAGYYTSGTEAATYYLYVHSSNGGSVNESYTLEYSLSTAWDSFEPDENAMQALGFTFGSEGALINSRNLSSPIDNDWYTFTVPANKNYNKLALTVSTASANSCGIEVYKKASENGYQMVKQNMSSNQISVSAGTYYVRIFNTKTIENFNKEDIQNYTMTILPVLNPNTIVITDLSGTEGLNHVVNYPGFGKHFRTGKGTLTVSGYAAVKDSITGELFGVPYTSVDAAYYNPYWDANNTPESAYITNKGLTDLSGKFNINLSLPSAVGANMCDAGVSYHYFDDCMVKVNVTDNTSISDNEIIFHFAYSIWHG